MTIFCNLYIVLQQRFVTGEKFFIKNNESDTYILETSKGKCTYSVDKNGYILSAQINSKNFRIDFSNQYELG